MRCSIIIPTYNRAESLRRSLAAVTRIDYGDYEVIVVDDGSTDDTEQVVRDEFPHIRYVRFGENRGDCVARNQALQLATGDLFVFTDDDCIVPRNWLRRHVAHFVDERVGAAGGPLVPQTPNFYDRFNAAHSRHLLAVERRIERLQAWETLITGNMSVARAVVSRVGTFDERFVAGGDVDLIRRISRAGYVFVLDPALSVQHLKSYSFNSLLQARFHKASGSILTDVKEGTLRVRRFVPLPNLVGIAGNWMYFRRFYGGSTATCVRFFAFAVLVRWTEVAGRVYSYCTHARQFGIGADGQAGSSTKRY